MDHASSGLDRHAIPRRGKLPGGSRRQRHAAVVRHPLSRTRPNPARKRFIEWLAAYVARSPTRGNSELLEAIATAQRPYE